MHFCSILTPLTPPPPLFNINQGKELFWVNDKTVIGIGFRMI